MQKNLFSRMLIAGAVLLAAVTADAQQGGFGQRGQGRDGGATRPLFLKDQWVVGRFNHDKSAALTELNSACGRWQTFFGTLYQGGIANWQCQPDNPGHTQWGWIYGAAGVLTINIPQHLQLEEVKAGRIGAADAVTDYYLAYQKFEAACQDWMLDLYNRYGDRFVGATCGLADEKMGNGYQFRFEAVNGVVYLAAPGQEHERGNGRGNGNGHGGNGHGNGNGHGGNGHGNGNGHGGWERDRTHCTSCEFNRYEGKFCYEVRRNGRTFDTICRRNEDGCQRLKDRDQMCQERRGPDSDRNPRGPHWPRSGG